MLREKTTTYREAKKDRKEAAQLDYDSAPARDLDNLRTDATEILGQSKDLSHFLRDRYRHKTDRVLEMIDKAENKKDTLGVREKYLEYRDNRTTTKIARLQSSIKNSSGSFLSRQMNGLREQRIQGLKLKKKFITHSIGDLEKKRTQKPEKLQKKIDEYVRKKTDAMYRKAQREALRENRIGKHNFMQRAEFIAKMTPDKKKEIMREAILLARKNNIERGRLETDYGVDNTLNTRKVDEYERTIE